MNNSGQGLVVNTRKIFTLQITIATVVAAGFLFAKGALHAQSAVYGGLISLISALLLGYGIEKAAQQGSKSGQAILYAGAAFRFVLVLVMFVIGLSIFKLEPLATVTGFILTQLSFLVVNRYQKQR
ncbi:MAG: ATP synthase subunit I [Gammaproteobacteria bacterium]